jgi:hypothetical protein
LRPPRRRSCSHLQSGMWPVPQSRPPPDHLQGGRIGSVRPQRSAHPVWPDSQKVRFARSFSSVLLPSGRKVLAPEACYDFRRTPDVATYDLRSSFRRGRTQAENAKSTRYRPAWGGERDSVGWPTEMRTGARAAARRPRRSGRPCPTLPDSGRRVRIREPAPVCPPSAIAIQDSSLYRPRPAPPDTTCPRLGVLEPAPAPRMTPMPTPV